MAPRGIGSFIMMPLVGLMTGRFDPRKLLTVGLVVGGGTLLWLSSAEPAGRLLGHLLAAVHSGRRHVAAVRAADDGGDGSHSARAHGQRHQPVQPDAQHRRQRRHRDDRHDAGAPPARRRRRRSARTSRRTIPATQRLFAQMRGGFMAHGRGRTRPPRSAPTRRCSAWCSGRRRWCRSSGSSSCSASCSSR